jgi:hypothetical protein
MPEAQPILLFTKFMRIHILVILVTLVCPICSFGDEVFSCAYEPKKSEAFPIPELTSFDNCGTVDRSGKMIFAPEHLKQVGYEGKGNLACIYVKSSRGASVYYVNSKDKSIETVYFDNGCDYFESGLARTKIDGRIAYFNRNLEIVLVTPYESASPFYDGLATACRGGKYVRRGEHTFLSDAECAYFGLDGKIVVGFMPQNKLPNRAVLKGKSGRR